MYKTQKVELALTHSGGKSQTTKCECGHF